MPGKDWNHEFKLFLSSVTSNEELMVSPVINNFASEITKGKILDLGFGGGGETLFFLNKGFEVVAIDKEQYIKDSLLRRIQELNVPEDKYRIIVGDLVEDIIPDEKYEAIILLNILHFFNPEESQLIVERCISRLSKGGFIFVIVHHADHPENQLEKIDIKDRYFKQFFTEEQLEDLFGRAKFQLVYRSKFEILPLRHNRLLLEFISKNNLINKGYDSNQSTISIEYGFKMNYD